MLNISDLQEKRSIVAYSMAGDKKHAGLENVWRRWFIYWKEDFTINGGVLTRRAGYKTYACRILSKYFC